MNKREKKHLLIDGVITLVSIIFAIVISQYDLVSRVVTFPDSYAVFKIFLAGLAFTSIFTIAPAIVVLAKFTTLYPLWLVASIGAVGALCTDLIIFSFFRNRVADDFKVLISHAPWLRPLRIMHTVRMFRFVSVAIGAVIIASPLPDELGVAIMGISDLSLAAFIPISLSLNAVGIWLIGLIANAVVH